jgi:hypothetical protein
MSGKTNYYIRKYFINLISRIFKEIMKGLAKPFFKKYGVDNMLGLISKHTPISHPIIKHNRFGPYNIIEIAEDIKLNVFNKDGIDQGYHNYSNAWWYNINCPYSYAYLDIESIYPKTYFTTESSGHPDKKYASDIYCYMQRIYKDIFNCKFYSVLELGTGGGNITYQFLKNNIDFTTVEGTSEGYNKLIALGIPENRILNVNLKKLIPFDKRFDIVMCTEVIEHIEPFFASKIVELCTYHSSAVWFSAADRNRLPHYHHSNEIGIEAWDNLFAYFGFNIYIPLNSLHGRADRLYFSKDLKFFLENRISNNIK